MSHIPKHINFPLSEREINILATFSPASWCHVILSPPLPAKPTLLFPISTQGLMNAWPPIDRDG